MTLALLTIATVIAHAVPTPSPTIHPLPSAQRNWYARAGARASGLDVALVRAVIDAESGGDPSAVSRAGAAGLMQLMPGTAADCGLDDRFDGFANALCGARTLALLVRRYGLVYGIAAISALAPSLASAFGFRACLRRHVVTSSTSSTATTRCST